MKSEYSFSRGDRGKFYSKDAVFHFPIYLPPDISNRLAKLAEEKGVDISELAEQIIKRELETRAQ